MIPYCRETGVGLIPWSPLARGLLCRPADQKSERARTDFAIEYVGLTETERENAEIISCVEKVAKNRGVSMAVVATAWSLAKGCCPILGLSKVERIEEAVAAVKFKLTKEEIKYLEALYTHRTPSGFIKLE